jgi:hypothetical protein
MKKILGAIVQFTALVTMGYLFLHSSLILIADWLSPILSGQVYSFFTLLYLVAADPLRYPDVLAVWAISSIITGVFIRKRVGSVLTILSTWILIVSLSAVLVIGMGMEAQENVILEENIDPFEVMPPFPDGLTVTTISEAPILGEIYQLATSLMNEQIEELEPITMLKQFAGLFTFSIISKPLIAAVFSLIGVELGKRLEHIFEPTITEKRLMLKKRLSPESKIIVALFVLLSLSSTPVSALVTNLYTENLAAVVTEEGQAIVAGAFAGTNLDGLNLEAFSFDGFMGCILVSHQDILDVAYTYMEIPEETDLSEMVNLLPETLVAFIYLDIDPEQAQTHSNMIALKLSTFYDMEIKKLFPFSQTFEEEGFTHTLTMEIYQSPLKLEEFNTRYLNHYHESGGYIEAINMDQLIPGKVSNSAQGSLLFTGYINPTSMLNLVPVDSSMIPEMETEIVGISGFIGYWDNSATILTDSLSIEAVFNQENKPSISDESDFSTITIIAPGIIEDSKTLKMSTSIPVPLELKQMLEEELVKMGIQAELGGQASQALQITLDGIPLPLNLMTTRDLIIREEDKICFKITIQNQDTDVAQQVLVDDTASLSKYPNLTSEGNTVQEYTTIAPGESIVYEYTVTVDNPGTYTMNPIKISYRNMDRIFETESASTSFNVKRPSMTENLGTTINTLLDTDQKLSEHIPDNISKGLQVSTYGIVLYTIADSIRKLRSWVLS